jgi:type I restriction-modification system DNA methylase subunit
VEVYCDGTRKEVSDTILNKEAYLGLFQQNSIDKKTIYQLTKKINDALHFEFGIKNLYHRMIFTSCTLVAKRFGAMLKHDMRWQLFQTSIETTLKDALQKDLEKNAKLQILIDTYSGIKVNTTPRQESINNFIDNVSKISDNLNSDFWNGEDVMAIFFNEFTRYKGKSEQGQVFTPDHITSLMYRLIDVDKNSVVLDAACGSGAFLVKAMCNMIKESGGVRTIQATEIRDSQLYGIEFDREIYALACANMLIHKNHQTTKRHFPKCKHDHLRVCLYRRHPTKWQRNLRMPYRKRRTGNCEKPRATRHQEPLERNRGLLDGHHPKTKR